MQERVTEYLHTVSVLPADVAEEMANVLAALDPCHFVGRSDFRVTHCFLFHVQSCEAQCCAASMVYPVKLEVGTSK